MTSETKTWDALKADYLRQVTKALSSVKHPHAGDILEDVSSHLDQRFAELDPDKRTWENLQAIITEMGPASDYAELLDTGKMPTKPSVSPKYLLVVVLVFIAITAAMIILPMVFPDNKGKAYGLEESWSIEDLDHSFVDDPDIIGFWKSVDFVQRVDDFNPTVRMWKGNLFLKELTFMSNGRTSKSWTWTKDWIHHSDGKTKAQYKIKEIDGETYLFLPWLSGDVTIRGQKPKYYVLRKIRENRQADEQPSNAEGHISDINAKVEQLDINTATLDDVIRIFGEPEKYLWGRETFTKNNLPQVYIAQYPNDFSVVMVAGKVSELRFESSAAGHIFHEKIGVGSSLEEVLKVVGQPTETIVGETLPGAAKDSVLYKDIDARKGYCYYSRADQNVRFFFTDYKVNSLYTTQAGSRTGGGDSFRSVRPINSVNQFDDVRSKDLSKLDLSGRPNLIARLTFNQKTVWPELTKMPAGCNPDKIMTDALNPGLGVRKLHQQGITGKGVNVAIIDQPLYLDHPEFAGKIVEYYDTGCGTESSMHGPAVASLLVGINCGTAPDARVYYAAAPSWKRDTAYEARALDWIIEQNEKLPASEKIRVVSVSAAPSSPNVRDKNQHMWGKSCARAEAAGIIVLDCTRERGFIGPCWYNARFPDNVAQCTPGFLRREGFRPRPDTILVPTSPRTTAEQYDKDKFSYQYCGKGGGLSWAIPYCAGVLALGWQIRPDLPAEQMKELLFESAYTKKDGAKIINPKKFIRMVKTAKSPQAKYRRSVGK